MKHHIDTLQRHYNDTRLTLQIEPSYRSSSVIVRSSDKLQSALTTQNQLCSMDTSTNKPGVNQMEKTKEYYAGFDTKSEEIKTIGFAAARDKFNLENPPGQKWTGSVSGLNYARGEYQALCDNLNK